MAISFPAAPSNNDLYTYNGKTWKYNGTGWVIQPGLANFQPVLVSGTNIKTVNSQSVLGSGDLTVQATLVNQSNIKSINSTSLLGSGDIVISKVRTISITFDGAGAVLTTGDTKVYWTCPYTCTILGWYINSDLSGSCVIDVWKAVGIPVNANSIAGTEKPTLSTAQQASDVSLTTWTTTITAGDTLGFEVESAATVTKVVLTILVTT